MPLKHLLKALTICALLVSGLFIAGCQEKEHEPDKNEPPQGKMTLVLTDADGDFLSYTVDVTSISLHRRDGTSIETVPVNTRIDFAGYTDLSELFSVLTLPAGIYDSITFNVDYTNADIVVQDDAGNTYQATAVDAGGTPLGALQLQLDLGDKGAVRIDPARIAFLTIDFDLSASNTILGFDPATVQVEPFVVAHADVVDERDHRARGLLESVNLDDSHFTVDLRPFHLRDGRFGQLSVSVNDDTFFEIDGTSYQGIDGLNQLANKAPETPVIVFGTFFTNERTFMAKQVLAGSSVPWDNADVVQGVVIARDENTLTVHGAHTQIGSGSVTFRDRVLINVGPETRVSQVLTANGTKTIDDISVGARIIAVGQFTDAERTTLDATAGGVRLRMNQVKGQVVSVEPFVLSLARINGRPIGLFNFSGTGQSADDDVNPEMFDVDASSLMLTGIDSGDWLGVRGFFNSFGATPVDFFAKTVGKIALDHRAAHFAAHWSSGTTSDISFSDTQMTLNLTQTDRAVIKIAGIPITDVSQSEAYMIEPAFDRGIYAIKIAGQPGIEVFRDFSDYTNAVQTKIDNGSAVLGIRALGHQSLDMTAFKAVQIAILIK